MADRPAAVPRARRPRRGLGLCGRGQTGQALVELALIMPLLVFVFAALIQFGILFMVYLNILHLTRDVARWLAVNPDKTDAQVQTYTQTNLPSGLTWSNFTFTFPSGDTTPEKDSWPWWPNCAALNASNQCGSRVSGQTMQRVSLNYDATPHVILPQTLGWSYFRLTIPWAVNRYSYYVMVENRGQ